MCRPDPAPVAAITSLALPRPAPPASPTCSGALDYRARPARPLRRHLRRVRRPAAHRDRPAGPGLPAPPRIGGSGVGGRQPRRHTSPSLPRPCAALYHTRNHPDVTDIGGLNARALTETQRAMLGSRGIIRVVERCATPGTTVTTPSVRPSTPSDLRGSIVSAPGRTRTGSLLFRRWLSPDAVLDHEAAGQQRP
jgi:hypothetical protein